ncbi:STAS domain-containing protein [Fulvimarina endophytica]|uniref:STAS domain-containing protein n=1 Tax=Fulvimarina endophytica TaxID=2293836 RepID=A0A371X824_9HYPH|nr:STAS domain-containing protein [Fulvimarina endophytica]RFC65366.1 STAS domain-containing protein [Fulvimarina endophytica]
MAKPEALMTKASDTRTIELEPILDISHAAGIADRLRALSGAPVSVDASGVERIGTPVVQVLLSAARTWARAGGRFTIIAPSGAFLTGLTLLGLSLDDFGVPSSVNLDPQ